MKRWISGIGKALGGLLASEGDPGAESRIHRERVVSEGLRRLLGEEPDKVAKEAILSKQGEIDALHRRLQEEGAESEIGSTLQFDGLSRVKPFQEAGQGYLLVYVQGFLTSLLQQIVKQPKPLVSVVFRLHEDPSAHVPVLQRGHGLAFELPFFPEEGPAQLSEFLGELTGISQKGAAFAVETNAPVLPVWCRLDDDGITLEISPPLQNHESTEALTSALSEHFARRIRTSPAEMDWEADCWYPPANRLLPSRFPWSLALSSDRPLAELKPFRLLVRTPDSLREACLSVPAVRALKRGRPDVHLTVLSDPARTDFWGAVSECDAFHAVGDTAPDELDFDLGVVLNPDASALEELTQLQVKRTVGMDRHPASDRFDDALPMPRKLGPPEHRTRTYLRVAHRLGAQVLDDPALRAAILSDDARRADETDFVVGVAPESDDGSSYVWDAERFAEVIRVATPEHPLNKISWRVFLKGSATGTPWEKLGTEVGGERLAFVESASSDDTARLKALKGCRLLLANDNDWLHLAATVFNLPTVAIYGPSEPIETAPVSTTALTLRRHVECTPCFLKECPIDHRCLTEIESEEVVAAVEAMLTQILQSS